MNILFLRLVLRLPVLLAVLDDLVHHVPHRGPLREEVEELSLGRDEVEHDAVVHQVVLLVALALVRLHVHGMRDRRQGVGDKVTGGNSSNSREGGVSSEGDGDDCVSGPTFVQQHNPLCK